jgi:hypothetical protein
MGEFFNDGGFGMWPTLLFAFVAVALGVLAVLRPSGQLLPAVAFAGGATFFSGLLGFCMGLLNTLRFAQQQTEFEQAVRIAMVGTRESTNNLVLGCIPVVITCLLGAVAAFRAARKPA